MVTTTELEIIGHTETIMEYKWNSTFDYLFVILLLVVAMDTY